MNNENSYKTYYQQQPNQQQVRPSSRPNQQQQARVPQRSTGIEDIQQRYRDERQQQYASHDDRMQRMQVQFKNYVGMNDFHLVNAVVPQNSNDPSVPSNTHPIFDPPEAPPTNDESVNAVVRHEENPGMASNAFPHVFRDVPFYQQPQSNLIVNPVPAYLTIDSRDRDRRVWPNTNQYRIPLVASDNDLNVKSPNVRYKNIYSISLLSCVIPNHGGVMFEPYLILQIDEIDRVYDSADIACSRAFTKLYFKEVCRTSRFFRLDKGVGDPLTKIYWPAPRASLESITLSFRHPDGTLFDFGADAPLPDPVLTDLQTTITLEIRTFVTDTGKAIGHRNP
jgi:hypothetical protein